MNYLLSFFLMFMPPSQASHCPQNDEFKFGDLVKIKSSSRMDQTPDSFVVGLSGEVVDKYYSEYEKNCSSRYVYQVMICTKNKACYNHSFCAHDLELVPK